jgi:hypothetical protein
MPNHTLELGEDLRVNICEQLHSHVIASIHTVDYTQMCRERVQS